MQYQYIVLTLCWFAIAAPLAAVFGARVYRHVGDVVPRRRRRGTTFRSRRDRKQHAVDRVRDPVRCADVGDDDLRVAEVRVLVLECDSLERLA